MGRFPAWTEAEDQILRVVYPSGGTAVVLPMLPGRTRWGVRTRASHLRIVRASRPWHQAEDAVIRKLYPLGGRNAVMAVIRRGPQAINQRAHDLGVVRRGHGRWTPEEDRVLQEVYPKGGMKGALAALPWRGWTSVDTRRAHLGLRRAKLTDEERKARRVIYYVRHRERRRRADKRRHIAKRAAGLCGCGKPSRPGRSRCKRCSLSALRTEFKRRYGQAPGPKCERCSAADQTAHGAPRRRRAWAIPGSPFCGYHQPTKAIPARRPAEDEYDEVLKPRPEGPGPVAGNPPDPLTPRMRSLLRRAKEANLDVEPVICGCGKHLVQAGASTCRFCFVQVRVDDRRQRRADARAADG